MTRPYEQFVAYIKYLSDQLSLPGYTQADYTLYPYPLEENDMPVVVGNHCRVCKKKIKVQINKGTSICSESCKKAEKGERPIPRTLAMGAI